MVRLKNVIFLSEKLILARVFGFLLTFVSYFQHIIYANKGFMPRRSDDDSSAGHVGLCTAD